MAFGQRAWKPRPSELLRLWQAGFARRRQELQEPSPSPRVEGQMVAVTDADRTRQSPDFCDDFFETSLRAHAERPPAPLWPALPCSSEAPLLERRAAEAGAYGQSRSNSVEPRTPGVPSRPPNWGALHSPPKHARRRRIAEALSAQERPRRGWSSRSEDEACSPPSGWARKRLRSEERRSPSRGFRTPAPCRAWRTPPSSVKLCFEGAPRPGSGATFHDGMRTPPHRESKAGIMSRTEPPPIRRSDRRQEEALPRLGAIVFEGNPFRTVRRRLLLDDWDEEEEPALRRMDARRIDETPDSPEASETLAIEFLRTSD